jgi:hypothetical protein
MGCVSKPVSIACSIVMRFRTSVDFVRRRETFVVREGWVKEQRKRVTSQLQNAPTSGVYGSASLAKSKFTIAHFRRKFVVMNECIPTQYVVFPVGVCERKILVECVVWKRCIIAAQPLRRSFAIAS